MMAGNPNWWSMNGMHPQVSPSQYVFGSSNNNNPSQIPSNPSPADHDHQSNQDFPVRSWSQLLLGGLAAGGEEERYGASLFQQQKKLENWEDQVLNLNPPITFTRAPPSVADVKQEIPLQSSSCQLYGHINHHADHDQFQANYNRPNSNSWINPPTNHQLMPVSSPTSCITTNLSNNNILNFSGKAAGVADGTKSILHHQDHSSECNSTVTGGVAKKARVQHSSAQPALKVRKEKLGDRITALHQIVSPFGKTDTASVLSEAIGYIRFLHGQIEALSSPYMHNGSGNNTAHHQLSVQGRNCLFPEESGQDSQGLGVKDLRSRGLCLVPISFTQNVGNDNGADYWAPAALGGGF